MSSVVAPRWHSLTSRPVRSLVAGSRRAEVPELVVVPGLGALGYLLPWVVACSAWTRVHLLDVPGFGTRATSRCPSGLADAADTVAEWLGAVPEPEVVVIGHSTGAQVALRAVLAKPAPVASVVLAGPTFPPEARSWAPLIARVARTLRHESPGEVRATFPDYLRGRSRVVKLLRTSMADEPERRIGRLACPVLVVRGRHDAVSPAPWAARLANEAQDGRLVTVPGAHNFCFTDPDPASAALHEALLSRPGASGG